MNEKKTAIAKLKYLHMAPRKVRFIADLIKGKHIVEAEAQLLYCRRRAAKPILKLLHSAINNALNKKLNKDTLYISSITVDQGPMLKRWLPRAMGRATPIQKKMSHITMVLSEGKQFNRFVVPKAKITKSEKSIKKEKVETKKAEYKQKEQKVVEKKPKEGAVKKFFRRKEIA
ncbi:MAG: 50S ribosomal protein L22 [Patescibacteria group bacterium]|jgi:large subunit ribosomal protein L22|nr:50S ribosomal protein L22 [Patescibacteria group bacterium]